MIPRSVLTEEDEVGNEGPLAGCLDLKRYRWGVRIYDLASRNEKLTERHKGGSEITNRHAPVIKRRTIEFHIERCLRQAGSPSRPAPRQPPSESDHSRQAITVAQIAALLGGKVTAMDDMGPYFQELQKDARKVLEHAEEAAQHWQAGDQKAAVQTLSLMHYPMSHVSGEINGLMEEYRAQGITPEG